MGPHANIRLAHEEGDRHCANSLQLFTTRSSLPSRFTHELQAAEGSSLFLVSRSYLPSLHDTSAALNPELISSAAMFSPVRTTMARGTHSHRWQSQSMLDRRRLWRAAGSEVAADELFSPQAIMRSGADHATTFTLEKESNTECTNWPPRHEPIVKSEATAAFLLPKILPSPQRASNMFSGYSGRFDEPRRLWETRSFPSPTRQAPAHHSREGARKRISKCTLTGGESLGYPALKLTKSDDSPTTSFPVSSRLFLLEIWRYPSLAGCRTL